MKITKEELKNTLQIATGEVLNELKGEVAEIVEEAIVPAIKTAVDKFQEDLKECRENERILIEQLSQKNKQNLNLESQNQVFSQDIEIFSNSY